MRLAMIQRTFIFGTRLEWVVGLACPLRFQLGQEERKAEKEA